MLGIVDHIFSTSCWVVGVPILLGRHQLATVQTMNPEESADILSLLGNCVCYGTNTTMQKVWSPYRKSPQLQNGMRCQELRQLPVEADAPRGDTFGVLNSHSQTVLSKHQMQSLHAMQPVT